jgi:hypothetical protein
MSEGSHTPAPSRRARRIEEAVLELDGVAMVRVWELPDHVEIGVRAAPNSTPSDVLQRVTELTRAMCDGDEVWEVGLLTET